MGNPKTGRDRVRGLRGGFVSMLLASLASAPCFAQGFDDVKIETIELGSGLAMLIGRGGNIGVSTGRDGNFVIDDQYAPLTPRIRAAVAKLGRGPIRFVINTHWHGDHTGGNENLAAQGAVIVAHDNVRTRMATEQFVAAFDRRIPPSSPASLPVITFEDRVTLHLNGQSVTAIHVGPAHTDGDAIIVISPANVIHTGDVYVAGAYPFIDISSGGSFEGLISVTDQLLELTDAETRIIPGHGPLSKRVDLDAWRAMLIDVRGRILTAIEAGRSADEVVASKPTKQWDARYGGGFMSPDQFVRIAYESLSPAP
jgi:cyclase